jgi:hypothetical protein
MIELIVPNEKSGTRLDRFLAAELPQFSRARLQTLTRARAKLSALAMSLG